MLASNTTSRPELQIVIRDRTGPIEPRGGLETAQRGRWLPHRPIISDGLLRAFEDHGWVSPRGELGPEAASWPSIAPLVEELWQRHAQRVRPRGEATVAGVAPAVVEQALALAEAAELRSFGQGIEAAGDYLLDDNGARLEMLASRVAGQPIRLPRIQKLTLTTVKEAHTAGVLQVAVTVAGCAPIVFQLHVARDLITSAARLRSLASDLRVWHRRAPRCAAGVLDEDIGRIMWFGEHRRVAIVATEWLDGDELEVTQDAAGTHVVRLQGDSPVIQGERLDAARASDLGAALAEVRTALATFTREGVAERLFDINRGDAVLLRDRHDKVALIGSAALSWCGALGEWPYRLGSTAARNPDRGGRRWLLLGQVARSVASGLATMRRSPLPHVRGLVDPMIEEALDCDPSEAFSTDLSLAEKLEIVEQVRGQLAHELR